MAVEIRRTWRRNSRQDGQDWGTSRQKFGRGARSLGRGVSAAFCRPSEFAFCARGRPGRAGTAMPLRRNGHPVSPEPPRVRKECGCLAPFPAFGLRPLRPRRATPHLHGRRPPTFAKVDPPSSRRSTPHLREGQPPSSTEKAGGAPRGVPSTPAEFLEVALYIRSRGSGF